MNTNVTKQKVSLGTQRFSQSLKWELSKACVKAALGNTPLNILNKFFFVQCIQLRFVNRYLHNFFIHALQINTRCQNILRWIALNKSDAGQNQRSLQIAGANAIKNVALELCQQ